MDVVSRGRRRLLLAAAVAVLGSAPAASAHATSCVADPLATPDALTDGTHAFRGGDFFDHYDYALVGTVTGKSAAPGGGRTTVVLDVTGVLGRPSTERSVDLSLTDDGQLNGYRFTPGRAYFVPVLDRGPNGLTSFSHVCDPIAELTDPEAEFVRLSTLAGARSIETASPPGRTRTAGRRPLSGMQPAATWLGAGAAILAGVVLVVAARRRT